MGILLLCYTVIQLYCIQKLSPNYDEGLFAYYGTTILKLKGNKDVALFDSKLPITALNMLPRAVEQVFNPSLKRNDSYIDIIHGRYISLLAAILLSLVVYRWSATLYGNTAGFCSFVLILLCPNFLCNGIFVSSDIFACLFMASGLFFLWKFGKTGSLKSFLCASFCVAFAQISKFSMVHLLILFPLLLTVMFIYSVRVFPCLSFSKSKIAVFFLLFFGINWLVVSAGHLFYGMFVPLNDYQFRSTAFQHLQSMFHGVGSWLPVPLPSSYISSMDAVMYFDSIGGGVKDSLNGPTYLLGKSSIKGFWYYYFVALFFKLAIPTLCLLIAALFYYTKRFKKKQFLVNEMFLLIPSLYYLIYLNFFYSTQVGIRHIIIILPLLYIFAGYFFAQVKTNTAWYGIYALLAWQFISVARYFPDFVPYTNEFIVNKKMAYTKIADTNLCYGEGIVYLQEYLEQHPDAQYLPGQMHAGKIIMEVNEMLNLNINTMKKYDWARKFVPEDHIHSQYLIFNITPAMIDSLNNGHVK